MGKVIIKPYKLKKIVFTPNKYGLTKTCRVRMHDDAQK
jgi:hypothetical protein